MKIVIAIIVGIIVGIGVLVLWEYIIDPAFNPPKPYVIGIESPEEICPYTKFTSRIHLGNDAEKTAKVHVDVRTLFESYSSDLICSPIECIDYTLPLLIKFQNHSFNYICYRCDGDVFLEKKQDISILMNNQYPLHSFNPKTNIGYTVNITTEYPSGYGLYYVGYFQNSTTGCFIRTNVTGSYFEIKVTNSSN